MQIIFKILTDKSLSTCRPLSSISVALHPSPDCFSFFYMHQVVATPFSLAHCIQSLNITIIKLNTGLIYQAANNYMTLLPFALRSSSSFFCCIPCQVPNVGVPFSFIHLVYIP